MDLVTEQPVGTGRSVKRTMSIACMLIAAGLMAACRTPQLRSEHREVVVLGTVHRFHLQPALGYSLSDLQSEVEQLKPQVICGETAPQALGGPLEGVFPPEAAFLA